MNNKDKSIEKIEKKEEPKAKPKPKRKRNISEWHKTFTPKPIKDYITPLPDKVIF